MICKHCRREYDMDDFTDDTEACDDICPDCLYSGNMFSVEDDTDEMEKLYEEEDDLYDDGDNYLDAPYDDIDVSDEEFDEDVED